MELREELKRLLEKYSYYDIICCLEWIGRIEEEKEIDG